MTKNLQTPPVWERLQPFTSHPKNCTTCRKRMAYMSFGYDCPFNGYDYTSRQIEQITSRCGCVSHVFGQEVESPCIECKYNHYPCSASVEPYPETCAEKTEWLQAQKQSRLQFITDLIDENCMECKHFLEDVRVSPCICETIGDVILSHAGSLNSESFVSEWERQQAERRCTNSYTNPPKPPVAIAVRIQAGVTIVRTFNSWPDLEEYNQSVSEPNAFIYRLGTNALPDGHTEAYSRR